MTYQNNTGLPSVTEVFSPYVSWDHISPQVLQAASERGSRVHQAIADELNGEFACVASTEQGYMDAFHEFYARIGEGFLVEKRLCSAAWGFTGQIDLVARIIGDTGLTLIDWKTSSVISKSWPLQLAAYRHLATGKAPISRTMAVQLRRNGTFKINEYTNPDRDFSLFLNALTIYKYFNPKRQSIDWESL